MTRKLLSITAAVGLLLGSSGLGYAQSPTQKDAPGQRMQDRGSMPGEPGAAGNSPGHQMQDRGGKAGSPGASGFAPGRQDSDTTTGRGTMGDRDPDRGRGDER
jgi:hypothetical protein